MERNKLHKRVLWITETAVLLALLVTLQMLTSSLNNQILTGSCVNTVLAVAALVGGLWCGVAVAAVSPVFAFLLNIAPPIPAITPAIMAGNLVFVVMLWLIAGKCRQYHWRQIVAWIVAAAAKFGVLAFLVAFLILRVFADALSVKPMQVEKLTPVFTWTQLITALIGGALALSITPLLKKALKK